MIRLTRLNSAPLVVNSDLIEHLEMTPDTVITLTTGQKLLVRESSDEVIHRVIEFRRAVLRNIPSYTWPPGHEVVSTPARQTEEEVFDGK